MQNTGSSQQPIRSDFADDADMRELVELFVGELPGRVASLQESFEQGEIESAARVAHQLSGASGGYGFTQLGDVARALETRLKAIDSPTELQSLRTQVDELVSMCGRVVV